jgi:hypothetical protein
VLRRPSLGLARRQANGAGIKQSWPDGLAVPPLVALKDHRKVVVANGAVADLAYGLYRAAPSSSL